VAGRSVREAVLERDGHKCQICGREGTKRNPLTMHHIIYRCQGGRSTLDNLVTWCTECHREFHRTHPVSSKKKRKKRGRKCGHGK
jgi:5-methylcytosine-specific restriction endonuclease McrA